LNPQTDESKRIGNLELDRPVGVQAGSREFVKG